MATRPLAADDLRPHSGASRRAPRVRLLRELTSVTADPVETAIATALTAGALPGELDGFDAAARTAAARFVAATAGRRPPGQPAIALEPMGREGTQRRMRLGIVNDDMPFLVDSVAAALAGHGLAIHRLLHPVAAARRGADGQLLAILPAGESGERRESLLYIELDRAEAKLRRGLADELAAVLADVRAAVADYPRLQAALRDEAERLPAEGAALARWFVDGHFTLLGHHVETRDGTTGDGLGILREPGAPLWPDAVRATAFAWFEAGGEAPLLLKADRVATVHRRVALDLIVAPRREGGRLTGLAVHAGLWTSAALAAPVERVPVLRHRLTALEDRYGFAHGSHAGKALRHALSALPHDLLIALDAKTLEALALTAMSLADRPRPKLMLAAGPLARHLFAFVWLPRDALSTARRVSIGEMLAEAAGGPVSSWSLELGEGELALIRYTLDLPPAAVVPDAAPLDAAIEGMLRGWAPAVEANLAATHAEARAARMALAWAEGFPAGYRTRYDATEAARDVTRLAGLADDAARDARFYRVETDAPERLRLKTYRLGGLIPLSDAVPVLENFGFRVLKETPTPIAGDKAYIHEFLLELAGDARPLLDRAAVLEPAIAATLEGRAENDPFNALLVTIAMAPRAAVLLRAWFRYLRQTGLAYGLATVVEALRRAPDAAHGLIALFEARHAPAGGDEAAALAAVDEALASVAALDDDRILRRFRAVILAVLRTNAFTPAAAEALAFKLDSAAVPGLPKPLPWREIWVYSPRVEGIHLRGGPIARGGLRWSDRRDDFRTEILGLMKAQLVKNAVIVPTGAKGGFYPKLLPPASDRDAWLAEGTESYRVFIRTLLSVTDNLVEGAVVHPDGVRIRDADDPYFVVAADKGTATFSDVANAIAIDRGFWLGDAFASGGGQGYDHKAMGITAKGAWVSVQRHFAELGVDVQTDPISVAGCGDMSGDVFGNGMLLSKSLKLVAAFDHRHIFLDPNPDPARSWQERARMFALPRSSWADYDASLLSPGGGIFPRTQKAIPLSPEIRAVLGTSEETLDPSQLIAAILKAPVDLFWFGGIGTYVKGPAETNVGDAANDAHRVDGGEVGARAIGEGANLGVTQAGRIAFALKGGRINTDFIDNSAGVDCSDNEVNIKIALNREVIEGRLGEHDRNALLVAMTDDVAALVLEDNRLQTLALSLAERGGAGAMPSYLRLIATLEAAGRVDRAVDGLADDETFQRRAADGHGLTRPELAGLLSHGKLALQAAIEAGTVAADPLLRPMLHAAFPPAMRARFAGAIDAHRLAGEIVATKLANRVVNRLGLTAPFELAEEAGVALDQVAAAYATADALLDLEPLYDAIEGAAMAEEVRLTLLAEVASAVRRQAADLLRSHAGTIAPAALVEALRPALVQPPAPDTAVRARLADLGAPDDVAARLAALHARDGAIATAALAGRLGGDADAMAAAYERLGTALGLDWAQAAATGLSPADPWERLLAAGLARDFEQMRIDFLQRDGAGSVEAWLAAHEAPLAAFTRLVDRARAAPAPTAAMLAQLAAQARTLLAA